MLLLDVAQLALPRRDQFLQLLQLGLLASIQRRHLQRLQPLLVCLVLLGQARDVHVAFLLAQLELGNLLLRLLRGFLERSLLLTDGGHPREGLLVRSDVLLNLLLAESAHRRTHAALHDLVAAAAHRAARVDELAIQGDDAPPLPTLHSDPRGLVQVLGDQRVLQREVEGHAVLIPRGLDQIDQPRSALRRFDLLVHLPLALLDLFQGDARGTAQVVLPDELDNGLCVGGAVDNDGVKHAASCGDGDVVLLRDRPQVAQAAMHAMELPGRGGLVDRSDQPRPCVLLLELRLGLLGLGSRGVDRFRRLLHLAGNELQPRLGLRGQTQTLRLQLRGLRRLLLPGLQPRGAVGLGALELFDLLGNLCCLLPEELRLSLRYRDHLLHLREALLQWHQRLLLRLLEGPKLLRLAFQAGVDLLELLCILSAMLLSAFELLLPLRRIATQLLGVGQQLGSGLLLPLCGRFQLLDLLLLKRCVLVELHILLLQLLEVGCGLLHLRLYLRVVAEVAVVLLLDGRGLLLELLHALAVLLHVALELLRLGLEAGEVAVIAPSLGLRDQRLEFQALGLRRHPGLGLLAGAVQALALALGDAQPV
mmetsp:Transcript_126527/g.366288  ORF Transcript_126527/g.366288 Transcript_126527/m.366288 type:complete len:592 (-) Transcript_126527:1243-3018(-)